MQTLHKFNIEWNILDQVVFVEMFVDEIGMQDSQNQSFWGINLALLCFDRVKLEHRSSRMEISL